MKRVNLLDNNFSHHKFSKMSYDEQYSTLIQWNRDIKNNNDLVIITDYMLNNHHYFKNKIAWIIEPKTILQNVYHWIKLNYKLFNGVFTHDKELLDIGDKFKFVPVGGSWIWEKDQKIWDKTKLVDIIASNKTMTEGHRLRHSIIDKYKQLDVYGRGINELKYKLDGLKDYRFQVVVENGNYDYYFTEKIMDCFLTGTIPIYWGCPSIGDFFNLDGILKFNTLEELDLIMISLTEEKYNIMINAIYDNFIRAKDYLLGEDYMVKNKLI